MTFEVGSRVYVFVPDVEDTQGYGTILHRFGKNSYGVRMDDYELYVDEMEEDDDGEETGEVNQDFHYVDGKYISHPELPYDPSQQPDKEEDI